MGRESKFAYIAMSGGVDSAVTAYRMQQAGFTCVGATMKLYTGTGHGTEENIADARAVAERLGMPFLVFDFCREFSDRVIRPFAQTYECGGTPNPCIACNRYLKFGALYEAARRDGADVVATGHYARVGVENGRYVLRKAVDEKKDQSYVLYALTQEQLAHVAFPLGELCKEEVRAIAQEQGFVNARKKESQDICFLPDGQYAAFISQLLQKEYPAGEFVDRAGKVLGTHRGIIHYTVGQRRGLGLALPKPYYVCGKDVQNNRVVLCPAEELPVRELVARDFNWVSIAPPVGPIVGSVRVRYHQKEQPALLTPLADGDVQISFRDGASAVAAPGQAVVAYDGDLLLGGGTIA